MKTYMNFNLYIEWRAPPSPF